MSKKQKLTSTLSRSFLVIVESPTKCSIIERYLLSLEPDKQYRVIASNGHFRMIDGLKSIQTKKDYDIDFSLDPNKKSHVDKMRDIIERYPKENIILATDDDREGEAIAWHICQTFDLSLTTTPRIVFHEITKPAIQAGIANPRTINLSLVYAQHARQVLDLLVGYRVSPLLWKYICSNGNLSAGRCQTPALHLVYENERENSSKVMETYHKVNGEFFNNPRMSMELNHTFQEESEIIQFLEKSRDYPHIFTVGEKKLSIRKAPKPFKTTTLLQKANSYLKYSPKEIMRLCQTLYQLGFITYMRTDSTLMSSSFMEKVVEFIKGKEWPGQRDLVASQERLVTICAAAITDNTLPHECIRVTNPEIRYLSLDVDNASQLNRMYQFIWLNTIQSCMIDATYDVQPLYVSAPDNYQYKTNYEVARNKGFEYAEELVRFHHEVGGTESKAIRLHHDVGGTETTPVDLSTRIATASLTASPLKAPYHKIYSSLSFEGKQSHYNEGGLIDQLEEKGIGRPSTMSMLIDIIQQRSYVTKRDIPGKRISTTEYTLSVGEIIPKSVDKELGGEKQRLVIENIGTDVIQFLMEYFEPVFNYDYTKTMEDDLDKIAESLPGEAHTMMSNLCKKMDSELQALIKQVKKINPEKKNFRLADTEEYVVVYQKGHAVLKALRASPPVVKERTALESIPPTSCGILKNIKKDIIIDKEKLERGEYTYMELVEIDNNCLGEYEGVPVYLKTGKYGPYLEYTPEGQSEIKRIAIQITKTLGEIKMEDIMGYLDGSGIGRKPLAKTVMREFGNDLSVRIGKHGPYLYYKTIAMSKPEFYSLRGFQSKGVRDICSAVRICEKNEMLEFFKKLSGKHANL